MGEKGNILLIRSKILPIYKILWERGPLSRREIQELTGLKLTTLVRSLDELKNNGFIIESGQGESSGGRRPVLYEINYRKAALIGIDISRTYIKIAHMDMKSNIIESRRFPLSREHCPKTAVSMIGEVIRSFKIKTPILGIGIGCVGPLDKEKGIILNPEYFPAPGWENVPLMEMLNKEIAYPVFLENGANCAALAEFYYGVAKECRSLGYIHVGVGIRSGVINHGSLVRTVDNRDDALGHMIVNMDGRECYCGNYGCLQSYCTLNGMLQEFKAKLKMGRRSQVREFYKGCIDQLPLSVFYQALKDKDPLAVQIMLDGAAALGIGVANFSNLLDLDLVIINGPVIQLSEDFYNQCAYTAQNKTLRNIRFSKGKLGDNAIVMGAGLLVLDNSLKNGALFNI